MKREVLHSGQFLPLVQQSWVDLDQVEYYERGLGRWGSAIIRVGWWSTGYMMAAAASGGGRTR